MLIIFTNVFSFKGLYCSIKQEMMCQLCAQNAEILLMFVSFSLVVSGAFSCWFRETEGSPSLFPWRVHVGNRKISLLALYSG